jgi:hypothetical protein
MGKIKAGNKTSKLQRFFKEPKQSLKQEVVKPVEKQLECPVIIDYKARKYSRLVRKELKQQVTNLMVADVKLATRYDNKLDILKQQVLSEIDGSFQANALPLEQLKHKVEELEAKLSQDPVVIQQVSEPKEVKVIEKQVTFTKELVLPNYVKYSLIGLALVNILIILFK